MNKERQKYLILLLDSYCRPLSKKIQGLLVLTTLATVAQVASLARLVDAFINDRTHFGEYYLYFLVLALSVVVKSLAAYYRNHLTQEHAGKVKEAIRQQVLERCQSLGSKGLGHSPTTLSLFYLEQVDLLNNYLARFYPQTLASRIQPMLVMVAVFALNWAAGLVLLFTAPLLPIFMILIGIKTSEMNAKQLKSLLYLGNQFHDKLLGIKTIIAFGRQEPTLKKMAKNSQHYTNTTMDLLKIAFLNSAVLEFLSSICIALMALYFGISYLEGYSLGSYLGTGVSLFVGFFCLTLANEFYQPFKDLGAFYHDRSSALNAIDELERFIKQPAVENQDYVDITPHINSTEASEESKESKAQSLYESSFDSLSIASSSQGYKNAKLKDSESSSTSSSSSTSVSTSTSTSSSKKQKPTRKRIKSVPLLDAQQAPLIANLNYPFQARKDATTSTSNSTDANEKDISSPETSSTPKVSSSIEASSAQEDFCKLDPESFIEAKDLTIYTHSGKVLLSNLNFKFQLKEKIAIVGLSGAGKTSLLSVLMGLYPYQGSLTFNGQELSSLNREEFYAYFSWLGQNPNLAQESILANLSYQGPYLSNDFIQAPRASASQTDVSEIETYQAVAYQADTHQAFTTYLLEQAGLSQLSIQEAIRLSCLEQLIADKGLEFKIQQHNRGLSGGQIQRIALARALAKPHLYLVIDEPTANLDAELEAMIFQNIAQHQQGVLMVTHRLEHARYFDKVYLLNQGLTLVKEGDTIYDPQALTPSFAYLAQKDAAVKTQSQALDIESSSEANTKSSQEDC